MPPLLLVPVVVIRRKIVSLQVLKHQQISYLPAVKVVIRRKIVSLQVLKHHSTDVCETEKGCDSQKNCIFASS